MKKIYLIIILFLITGILIYNIINIYKPCSTITSSTGGVKIIITTTPQPTTTPLKRKLTSKKTTTTPRLIVDPTFTTEPPITEPPITEPPLKNEPSCVYLCPWNIGVS